MTQTTAETSTGSPPERPRGKYIKGWQRAQLVRDIAIGAETLQEIAEKYDRAYDTVKEFASRNRAEIQRVRADYGSELSVLWVANKFNRIAQLQQYLDDIMERFDDQPVTVMTAESYLKAIQVCQRIMRDVAEEIGDLPTRAPHETQKPTLQYSIKGVDMAQVFNEE